MKFNALLVVFFVGAISFYAKAQQLYGPISAQQAKQYVLDLKRSKSVHEHTKLSLSLANYYLKKAGEKKTDLDSCSYFVQKAILASKLGRNSKAEADALIINASLYHEKSDTRTASEMLKKLIKRTDELQHFDGKARALYELASFSPLEEQLPYFEQALVEFRRIDNQIAMARVLVILSDRDMASGRFDRAYEMLLEAIKYEQKSRSYVLLAGVAYNFRDQTESLKYGLLAVEAAKREKNDRAEAEAYAGLGEAYRLLRQDENALNAFRSAMAIMVRLNMFPGYYDVARGIAYTYLGAGKNALAIESYLHQMARFPATRNIDRFRYNVILTNLYVRSNDFKRATEHHNNAISLVPAGEHPDGLYSLTRTSAEFYYRFKEYDKARALFEHGNRVSGEKVDNLLRIASIDSANGNYQSAHRYGMRAKKLNDSLLSEARSKVVAGFQIKFDLKQKDNDLLMKDADLLYQKQRIRVLDQNALLLQQRTEIVAQEALLNSNRFLQAKLNADKDSIALRLKDQSITMLNKQASYQSLQLKEEAFSRKITYALIVLAIIVIILLIRQYLIKQRNSTVISEKNAQLEQLVKDKSWLLKEMHHRVKNNLQTVVSLLESQSAYLESDALAIVQNSQHRIFAMSLIHQRLYQHEQIASVDMSSYIPELTAYLKEYIGEDKYIAIEVDVDALHFDVSDAVPMGLILNEALTNAIKYAFKGRNSGKIMVSLKEISAGYRLRIIDDGVGLPLGFDISARDSLGLKLIRGLSHQLGGELLIQSNSGTEITVEGRNKLGS